MRLMYAPAITGPDTPGLEVHDQRERFPWGEGDAGGVLYVGLHGGEAGTVLTPRDALALVRDLVGWATERFGARAVSVPRGGGLAELPADQLRYELARRAVNEALFDPRKLLVETLRELGAEAGWVHVNVLARVLFPLVLPADLRRELQGAQHRGVVELRHDPALTWKDPGMGIVGAGVVYGWVRLREVQAPSAPVEREAAS